MFTRIVDYLLFLAHKESDIGQTLSLEFKVLLGANRIVQEFPVSIFGCSTDMYGRAFVESEKVRLY